MYTYQDLLKIPGGERPEFVEEIIGKHKDTELYRIAFDAEEYDRQNNITIMSYRKMLYDLQGNATEDKYTPNHKICSNFLNRFVTQENQYLLGNGMTLDDKSQKEKLGADFDQKLQRMGRNALVEGVSFGLWNLDHLETFRLTEFAPLYDEETSALMAGVRFFQISADKPLRATLYEPDGYTDYIDKNGKMTVLEKKRAYKTTVTGTEADGTLIMEGENYDGFPIIPMWGNAHHQSELVGLRQSIDAYDLIRSGFANDMDGAHLYWLLKNSGGMDDYDVAKLLERINVLHAAAADDESEISAHEINIPYESRVAYLDRLEQDMYRDYQALNVADISGGQKTATEINAAYQPFDNKVDQFEYCVLDFLDGLFKIAGVEGAPTFTRNKVTNVSDNIQSLLLGAQYLDDEYITKKICSYLGDPDEAQGILDARASVDLNRLTGGNGE